MGEVERLGERPRKPEPERTGPLRSWSGAAQPAAAPARSEAPDPPAGGAPAEGAPRAVGMGYRVIDDYLSQGRETAERLAAGVPAGLAAVGSFQSLTAQLLRDGLLWLEHMSRLVSTPDPAGDTGAAPRDEERGDAAASERFRVCVASREPAEVDLRLRARVADRELGVHALRSPDAAAPSLDDVRLAWRGDGWVVTVRVPDRQPRGLYTGVVYDRRDGTIQGTLAVRVGEGATA